MFRSYASLLRPLGIAAAAGFCAASLPARTSPSVIPNRIVQSIDENTRVTLHGYVHPLAIPANDRGAAPDSMPLERMHLVLKRSASQEAALQQLIAAMHTPGNPSYHKWLTPEAFGRQFGPSDQDIATVQAWLTSQGFQVTGLKPGRQVLEFTGNVAQFRSAFNAPIHQYMVNGGLHYAAASDPQIPAAIAPVVGGFVSLNNFRPKPYAHILGQATYNTNTNVASPIAPNWTFGSTQAQYFVLSPADFAVQYDLTPLYQNAIDGRGETVAIINESNINLDLVQQFRKQFLPGYSATNLPTIVIDGNDPGIDGLNNPDGPNYASDETYIDVEWAGAVAPNATVDLVIAADTNLESGLYLAAERAIYGDVAPIMSISFGACESALGSTNAYLNNLWEQAAAEGITVVVSSGDNGSAGCDDFNSQYYAVHGLAVSGFASTPWNVAVGGTDFYYSDYASGGNSITNFWNTTPTQTPQASLTAPIQEQPWNDSQFGLNIQSIYKLSGNTQTSIAGGSGGASSAAVCSAAYSSSGACSGTLSGYAKPAWQAGLAAANNDKVRDLPDVSLFAADGLNYSFYPFCFADGDCQPASGSNLMQISGAGGTSFGAPAFAGIMALVDQKYGAQGQADMVLYPLKTQYPAAFHDVTVGTNAEPCNSTTVGVGNQPRPPVNCITAPSGLGYTVTDPTYGQAVEGELGNSNGPGYNAATGYSLATGLGSIDANALVTNWGNVKFTTSTITMTASPASITHGQAVTISGTVTGSGTVGGNVALMTDSPQTAQQGANFGQVLAGKASTLAVSNGSYSGSVSDLPGGTYDVWGQYSGDGTNGPSTSSKTQVTVNPEASSLAFSLTNATEATSSPVAPIKNGATVAYGTQGTLTAQVAPTTYYNACVNVSSPASSCSTTVYTPPTGTITFADNGTTINTAAVNVEGEAAFNAPFSIGTHSVTASYAGDNSYNKASSSTIAFTVTQNQPNVYVGAANQNSQVQNFTIVGGQPTVFYVLLENSANTTQSTSVSMISPVAPPTGTITVAGPPALVPNGSATLTLVPEIDPSDGQPAGVAQVTFPATAAAGSYNLTISYSGDTNYTALTGNNVASGTVSIQTSALLATAMTASLSGTSITPNQSVTVTGMITGQSGHAAPTGAVYVYFNGNWITSFPLSAGSGSNSTFSGRLTSQVLAQGSNIITLYYAGDSVYNSNSYLLNSGTPIATPGSDFAMTASSGLVAVSASGTNKLSTNSTSTIYLTPTNGFSGTVNLSVPANCGVTSGLTCSLSQNSVSLSYSNTARVTPQADRWRVLAGGGGAALAFVVLLSIPARRRAWRNMLGLFVLICIAGFTMGCGGGSGSGSGSCNLGPVCSGVGGGNGGNGGGSGTPGTTANPTQSVTLTVTAASGVTVGHYGVTVTATSAATSQIHTLGVIAQVE